MRDLREPQDPGEYLVLQALQAPQASLATEVYQVLLASQESQVLMESGVCLAL